MHYFKGAWKHRPSMGWGSVVVKSILRSGSDPDSGKCLRMSYSLSVFDECHIFEDSELLVNECQF